VTRSGSLSSHARLHAGGTLDPRPPASSPGRPSPSRGEQVTRPRWVWPSTRSDVRTGDGETLRAWRLPHGRAAGRGVYSTATAHLALWSPVFVELARRGYGCSRSLPRLRPRSTGSAVGARPCIATSTPVTGRSSPKQAAARACRWSTGTLPGRSRWRLRVRAAGAPGARARAGFPDTRTLLAGNPVRPCCRTSRATFPAAAWMATVTCPTLVPITDGRLRRFPTDGRATLRGRLRGPKRVPRHRRRRSTTTPEPRDAETYWRVIQEFVGDSRGRGGLELSGTWDISDLGSGIWDLGIWGAPEPGVGSPTRIWVWGLWGRPLRPAARRHAMPGMTPESSP